MTVAHSGRGWRLALALIAMEAEADRIAPRRRTASDGSIGDAAHRARRSHHNPDGGFVDALDITHDPANGMDIHAHARAMVARRDPRLEEVISNGQIWTYARRSEGWRRYGGPGLNPHRTHGHFVVRNAYRNDTSPWFRSALPFATKPTPPPYRPPKDWFTMATKEELEQIVRKVVREEHRATRTWFREELVRLAASLTREIRARTAEVANEIRARR